MKALFRNTPLARILVICQVSGPVVQSPPKTAKMRLSWLLEPVEDPKDQNYFKTSYFEALGACEEFVINYEKMWAFLS